MPRIRRSRILLVVLAIIAIAHWEAIREAIAALELGGLWEGFAETLQEMPPGGKYVIVLMVLALLYISVYRLIVYTQRRRK
ncbi:MAG: hypothetical protein R6X20_17645 [Phycisphaerae bacterium]